MSARGTDAHRGGGGGGALAPSIFVELKTTRRAAEHAGVFALSFAEWEFLSREPPVRYHIYRVSGAGQPGGARITIIDEPMRALREGGIRLCLVV